MYHNNCKKKENTRQKIFKMLLFESYIMYIPPVLRIDLIFATKTRIVERYDTLLFN